MATAAQIEANRRNARKSTGPRTQQGKDRARMNALVHGLRASVAETDENEPALRRQLREQLDSEWKPGSILEHMIIDQIADTYVRLRRCPEAEWEMLKGRNAIVGMAGNFNRTWTSSLLKLNQYEARLSSSLRRLIQQLRELQRERFAKDAEEDETADAQPPGETENPPRTDSNPPETTPTTPPPPDGENEVGQTNPIFPEHAIKSVVTEIDVNDITLRESPANETDPVRNAPDPKNV